MTSGISGPADVWRHVRCAEGFICQPYLQSVFTRGHEILKSKANEGPKLLSSSGIRNQGILNFEVMVVRDKATIAFVEKMYFSRDF